KRSVPTIAYPPPLAGGLGRGDGHGAQERALPILGIPVDRNSFRFKQSESKRQNRRAAVRVERSSNCIADRGWAKPTVTSPLERPDGLRYRSTHPARSSIFASPGSAIRLYRASRDARLERP